MGGYGVALLGSWEEVGCVGALLTLPSVSLMVTRCCSRAAKLVLIYLPMSCIRLSMRPSTEEGREGPCMSAVIDAAACGTERARDDEKSSILVSSS